MCPHCRTSYIVTYLSALQEKLHCYIFVRTTWKVTLLFLCPYYRRSYIVISVPVLQDKYVITSLVLMCIVCVWHASLASLKGDPELALTADKVVMACLGGAYVIFNAIFIAKTKYTVRCCSTTFSLLTRMQQYLAVHRSKGQVDLYNFY